MNKNDLINIIEKFAPIETQEKWDNCGWQIITDKTIINKVMLCLSVTEDIISQAKEQKCDMIFAHHPLFFIPFSYNQDIQIYSAHTNMDKTDGGTTDTIISNLGFKSPKKIGDFLRIVDYNISLNNFITKLKNDLNIPYIRVVNNRNTENISKIAFCAGSGSEFVQEAKENGADVLVTGDIKYHTALDSQIVLIDIGHFESEILIVKVMEKLLKDKVETVIAKENSPLKIF